MSIGAPLPRFRLLADALMLGGVLSFALPAPGVQAGAPAMTVRLCGSAALVTIPLGPTPAPAAPQHGQKPCHVCDLRRRSPGP